MWKVLNGTWDSGTVGRFSSPCIVHDAVPSQAVVARALLTIIDKHLVLVLRLEETAHRSPHQAVLLDEFVAVVALFQQ